MHEYSCAANPDRIIPVTVPRRVVIPPPMRDEVRVGFEIRFEMHELAALPPKTAEALMLGIAKVVAAGSNSSSEV